MASYTEGVKHDQDWNLQHADLNRNTAPNLQTARNQTEIKTEIPF